MALLDLDTWLAAQDRYATPHQTLAFSFHFLSQTMHVWPGMGSIVTDDRTFLGVGAVGSISGLELGYGRPTKTTTITLSGLDTTYFGLAADQADEVHGRRAEIFIVGLGTGVKGEEWAPAAIGLEATREMDKMTRAIDHEAKASVITLTMEPIGAIRWRAAHGFLNDDDQRARYAGDLALERVGLVQWARPMKFE